MNQNWNTTESNHLHLGCKATYNYLNSRMTSVTVYWYDSAMVYVFNTHYKTTVYLCWFLFQVFFPINHGDMYYLLCYDLKKPAFYIIDHVKRTGLAASIYGKIPTLYVCNSLRIQN